MTLPAEILPIRKGPLALGLAVAAVLLLRLAADGWRPPVLLVIGLALGLTLYHAAFGFAGAYRRLFAARDITGVAAQMIMLAVAMLLFAPILAEGQAFGRAVGGALAPVGLSVAVGAFLFGVGMPLAGGCASGSLYTAGGGNLKMLVVLVFFCLGAFRGSLDLGWWQTLPGRGPVSLGAALGWPQAVAFQLAVLAALYGGLRLIGGRHRTPLIGTWRPTWRAALRGPWPLWLAAVLLAVLNGATLVVAGHAWSITWAFSLWGAKAAGLLGWHPAAATFWSGGFPGAALHESVLSDSTSVMDIGVLLGAFLAASLAGRGATRPALGALIPAVLGGLLLGYGARLAYGCNIGAFFSGVASTSLHGWLWIACALPGYWVGGRARRRLENLRIPSSAKEILS